MSTKPQRWPASTLPAILMSTSLIGYRCTADEADLSAIEIVNECLAQTIGTENDLAGPYRRLLRVWRYLYNRHLYSI